MHHCPQLHLSASLASPDWARPLLWLIAPVAVGILLDAAILRAARKLRFPRALAIMTIANLAGWMAFAMLTTPLDRALGRIPAAITSNPIKRLYISARLADWRDLVVLTAAIACGMLVATLAARITLKRTPQRRFIAAFAAAELATAITAAAWADILRAWEP